VLVSKVRESHCERFSNVGTKLCTILQEKVHSFAKSIGKALEKRQNCVRLYM